MSAPFGLPYKNRSKHNIYSGWENAKNQTYPHPDFYNNHWKSILIKYNEDNLILTRYNERNFYGICVKKMALFSNKMQYQAFSN